MFDARVPKDIRVYETKLVGGLTFRQCLCFVVGVVIDIVLYTFVFKANNISMNNAMSVLIILDVPIMAIGWFKPLNMPLEQYLKYVAYSKFLAPKNRKVSNVIYNNNFVNKTSKSKKDKKNVQIKNKDTVINGYL